MRASMSLALIVQFPRVRGVQKAVLSSDTFLDRDLAGKQQPSDRFVRLNDRECLIEARGGPDADAVSTEVQRWPQAAFIAATISADLSLL